MSSHTNLKSKKCWSCIYFGGKRKLSRFITLSVESEDKGTCMCNKCSYFGKEVSQNNSCSKWQIDKITFDAQREVEEKKNEKEKEKIKKEENRTAYNSFDYSSDGYLNDEEDSFGEYNDCEVEELTRERLDEFRQEDANERYKNLWVKPLTVMWEAFKYAKKYPDEQISKRIKRFKKIWYGFWICLLLILIFIFLFCFVLLPIIVKSR